MSDIIREVDEELRRERLQKLWQRYGVYVISAALLIVLGVAGWRGWEWYVAREAAKAGARFESALELAEANKRAEADALLAALIKDAPAGYALLARFRAAAELAEHDKAAGAAAYDALGNDPSIEQSMRDLAKVRAGLVLVDTAAPAEIAVRLEPLIAANSAFRPAAREILGLARFRAGDSEAARKLFAEVLADPETPPSMRSRAQLMLALLTGGETAPATQ
jgi:hypothetical protein